LFSKLRLRQELKSKAGLPYSGVEILLSNRPGFQEL